MDEYQYPLFFEAKGLTDTEMKTIRMYFQKRQVSGGGDCSAIQAVGGDVYKICFKDKEGEKLFCLQICYLLDKLCTLS